jgi:hypothetical protein
MIVLSPEGKTEVKSRPVAVLPRFADLRGKRIGLLDNSKPNADKLAGRLAELLQQRYGAGEIVMRRKLTAQEGAPQHCLDELAAAADLVLSGLGD